jgi:N-methylhydantoinase B
MSATIIQTNSTPFGRADVDGVTVDIIENALRNAREEMDAVLFRTAMSPGIREQGDCFPMIANREGKMVVGQFGSFIGPFLEAYDAEIEEGDVILTNDPYMCNAAVSHLPDWVVLVPVFKDGRHIAWSAMFGHMSDNGGMVPGSIPIQATTIYQEGIRIPPIKLYKKGVSCTMCAPPSGTASTSTPWWRPVIPRPNAAWSWPGASATMCWSPPWISCCSATTTR